MPLSLHVLENTEDGEPTISLHHSLDKEIFLKFNLNISICSLWLLPFPVSPTANVVGSILFVTLLCGAVGCCYVASFFLPDSTSPTQEAFSCRQSALDLCLGSSLLNSLQFLCFAFEWGRGHKIECNIPSVPSQVSSLQRH